MKRGGTDWREKNPQTIYLTKDWCLECKEPFKFIKTKGITDRIVNRYAKLSVISETYAIKTMADTLDPHLGWLKLKD